MRWDRFCHSWAALALCSFACRSAPPQGESGPAADALAESMQAAVRVDAWAKTGAIRWVFGERRSHLWDRRRAFSRVEWDENVALIDLQKKRGLVFQKKEGALVPVSGSDAASKLDEAHGMWTNDAFWLNPINKLFDSGTVREILPPENGQKVLLIRYTSGGRTPGDAYAWRLDASNRPVAWRMWTSNIPVSGVEASWEGWIELSTGAFVSTHHVLPLFTLELSEVKGAATLEALLGPDEPDPFRALAADGACGEDSNCASY